MVKKMLFWCEVLFLAQILLAEETRVDFQLPIVDFRFEILNRKS
jgi:hypothetical protein